jgi:type IV pilus assembly protein PilA
MFSSAIQRLHDRRDGAGDIGEDAGFTLIELMVVLLILAILLAIAIPTFLGVTKSANDRAVQSNLNTALTNAKSIFQNNAQTYAYTTANVTNIPTNAASLVAALTTAEPNLSFVYGAVTNGASPAAVSVSESADGNGLVLAEQAKGTNNCWFVLDNAVAQSATASTPYANVTAPGLNAGTYYGVVKGASSCSASTVPTGVTFQASGFPSS